MLPLALQALTAHCVETPYKGVTFMTSTMRYESSVDDDSEQVPLSVNSIYAHLIQFYLTKKQDAPLFH